MPTAIIIGSGPAAAGTAMALASDASYEVTVIDLGGQLEKDLQLARSNLASTDERNWSRTDVERISHQPVPVKRGAIPQKRAFGSDFPFRNESQLNGVEAAGPANDAVVSGAYGGFSNVWGAQIMPFSKATLDKWPVKLSELKPHYEVALDEMTLSGDEDDLSELFPLIAKARSLPQLGGRSQRVLDRYESHRALVRSHGITIGRARLAFKADECTRCGMCMTGCPYQLIYSASHTLDRLRAARKINYRSGLLATKLYEEDGKPSVVVRNVQSGSVERLTADRIFVACGGIGTTRLVLGSTGTLDRFIYLQEAIQFVMPTVSVKPAEDPRLMRNFTLNQFNLLYDHTGVGEDLCLIHFYDYNPAFLTSVPNFLRKPTTDPALSQMLRRVSVGLGYVPGWGSPNVKVIARRSSSVDDLPSLVIDREESHGWPPMLKGLVKAMMKVAPSLDFWPVLPALSVSAAAKSYHFGGSFPISESRSETTTDRIGRLANWDNIHLVDASVFPSVPATTFTLSIMANSHRIATEVMAAAGREEPK